MGRKSVAVALGIAGLAFTTFGQVESGANDPREEWNIATTRAELENLAVAEESPCSTTPVSEGWANKEPEIETLHGGMYSPYDGVCFPNFAYVDIEHIVARAEADESGMCDRAIDERLDFAIDVLNLTFAPNGLNASKGKRDAGEITTASESKFRDALTLDGKCFWAGQTVRVKSKYGLSVDVAEKAALAEILDECETSGISIGRPQAPAGCGWAIRQEYALSVLGTSLEPSASCSDPLETEGWRGALRYAPDIACIVELPTTTPSQPTTPATQDPRAAQIAAQSACKATLSNITCTSIEEQCPTVTVIHRGEPLYQPKGTNGRSNDSDDDGLYCEDL